MNNKKHPRPKNYKLKPNNEGFIALITVLIILGIVLLIGLSVSSLSVGEAGMSLQRLQSSQSYYLANLCTERALMELKEDSNYAGENMPNIENGSCTISVILVDSNREINIYADFQNQISKMQIIVSQINPEMIIESWQEVADF